MSSLCVEIGMGLVFCVQVEHDLLFACGSIDFFFVWVIEINFVLVSGGIAVDLCREWRSKLPFDFAVGVELRLVFVWGIDVD